jgi:hypothetical protein
MERRVMTVRALLLVAAYSVVPLVTSSTALPPQYLPIFGGAGGNGFTRSCGTGRVLTGLMVRAGLLVDAVGVLCRPVNADGSLGPESQVGSLAGGGSGTLAAKRCESGKVAYGANINYGSFVNRIYVHCTPWDKSQRKWVTSSEFSGFSTNNPPVQSPTTEQEFCEAKAQPINGIRGRASALVDAIGFTCDEP